MTEQYPPYNFEKNGKLRGIAVDLMVLMLDILGTEKGRGSITLVPWTRGYRRVQSTPNTCLFSMTRTETREKLLKWVGPIGVNRVVLMARRDRNIRIRTLADCEDLYYAFHKATPDSVVQRLQGALESLKASGMYNRLLDQYLK